MKRQLLSIILVFCVLLSISPISVNAANAEPQAVYVSSTGKDADIGTQDAPFATLKKAVDAAQDGSTIYVMDSMTMTECARFYNKNLTITSLDSNNPVTITRGAAGKAFKTQSDTARSWYNPAMIEVQGTEGTCGLTLTNIVLDDGGKNEGTVFAQAVSGVTEGESNLVYVQDAMIASNAVVPCTITLGEGAVLRNFGGMSAIRVTDQAQVVMKSGSVIEDTTVTNRTRSNVEGETGAAGAIWSQGSDVTVEDGAVIRNVIGRAIYMDGGSVSMDGTIEHITSDKDMWNGGSGTAIHLRNNATGTMSGTATGFSGGTMVTLDGCEFTLTETGKLVDSEKAGGIGMADTDTVGYNTLTVNGEIARLKGSVSPIQGNSATIVIGKTANIHDNEVYYGALYMQADLNLDIYGKINNNYGSKYGAALATPGHGYVKVTMHDGAELCGNIASKGGGALQLKKCTFVMNGGKIYGNITKSGNGGAAYLRENTEFIMNGGTISDNYAKGFGGGISYHASGNAPIPMVQLHGGMISGNKMGATVETAADGTVTVTGGESNDFAVASDGSGKIDRYVSVSNEMILGDANIYMAKDQFDLVNPAKGVKFGNASADSITALKKASTTKGWGEPLAALWFQNAEAVTTLTLKNVQGIDENKPVYALVIPADVNGDATGEAQVYAMQNLAVTLPSGNTNGYVLAVVQPTENYGALTVVGPAVIKKDKTAENYNIAYTVTYAMSDNLNSIIEQAGGNASYTLVVSRDAKLTGKVDTNSFDGQTISVTYQLPAAQFDAGKTLLTTAVLTVRVGDKDYVIPSNQAVTKMVPLQEFAVTAFAGKGGTIDPVGANTVTEGEDISFTITADSGDLRFSFQPQVNPMALSEGGSG